MRCFLPVACGLLLLPAALPAQTILADMDGQTFTQTADSASGIGDLDGNGLPEILLGSPNAPRGGRLMVYYDNGWFWREINVQEFPTFEMGRAVDGGDPLGGSGDANADGRPDMLAGAPATEVPGTHATAGAAVILSGTVGFPAIHAFFGLDEGDRFGSAVAFVGDVNGDAHDDALIGAPAATLPYAHLYSGADGSLLRRVEGPPGSRLGHAVCGVGDLNGDGRSEFAIGAPMADGNGFNSGAVYLYAGKTFALVRTWSGRPGEQLGFSLSAAGDVNADGVPDFIAGGNNVARVYSGMNGAVLHDLTGADFFGRAVTGTGDQNGDGYADFAVGVPFADDYVNDAGAAVLFSGADGAVLFRTIGHRPETYFGECMAVAGDTDGDGQLEYLIGGVGRNKVLKTAHLRPQLIGPLPGLADTQNMVTVKSTWPGAAVTLSYAFHGDFRPFIGCDGLFLEVWTWPYDPISQPASATGKAVFEIFLGPEVSGRTLYLQASCYRPSEDFALDTYRGAVTEVVSHDFP